MMHLFRFARVLGLVGLSVTLTTAALAQSTDFDFPTLIARCQSAAKPAALQRVPVRKSGRIVQEG